LILDHIGWCRSHARDVCKAHTAPVNGATQSMPS
jgi:hypothetical protein